MSKSQQELISDLQDENRQLAERVADLEQGLQDILEHQKTIAGNLAPYSVVCAIARRALE